MNAQEFEACFEGEELHTLGRRLWNVGAELIAWGIAFALIAGEVTGLIVIAGWLAGR